jgi:hypothetical protein
LARDVSRGELQYDARYRRGSRYAMERPEPIDPSRHFGERKRRDRGGAFSELRDRIDRLIYLDRRVRPHDAELQPLQQDDAPSLA